MTASHLCHPLTKQPCIKLISCRSFIYDQNNCQVPARGFRSLIKALLSEMDSCFSIVSQNLWGWKRSEEESDLTCWKQGQLWGQTRLLHVLASDVLKTFKNGGSLPRQHTSFQRGRKRGNGPCQSNLQIYFQFKCLSISRSSFYPPYSLRFRFTLISPYRYITTNDFIWFLGLTLLPFSH